MTRFELVDKLKGMLLLGAYGDALGGYRERAAIAHHYLGAGELPCKLQPYEAYFSQENDPNGDDDAYKRNTWRVWPEKADAIVDIVGIVTDDTSFRFTHYYPWIIKNVHTPELLTEENFINELRAPVLSNNEQDYIPGIKESHKEIASFFVEMYEAANREKPVEAVFFKPGFSVFFGSFMYLEIAAIKINESDEVLLAEFSEFSVLDLLEGKTVTALLMVLLKNALLKSSEDTVQVYDFLLSTGKRLLHTARHLGLPEVALLTEKMNFAIELGAEAKRSGLHVIFDYINTQYGDEREFQHYSSLILWIQFWSSLTYSAENPVDSLSVIAGGPGDSDTVCSFMGSILGAVYGIEELGGSTIRSEPLGHQLETIKENLMTLFFIEVEDLSETIAAYNDHVGIT